MAAAIHGLANTPGPCGGHSICGIAGIVNQTKPLDAEALNRMVERQRHRGPDDRGTWVSSDGRVGLGHARLSILDVSSAAHQPIANETGDVHLTYNGEIYNFPELRAELEKAGHRFVSRTDSEVVVHGYEEWGDDMVRRLRGMFAFAIWDEPKQRLLLARDRIGIKPLYYALDGDAFHFASELKAIEAGALADRTIDASALWDFLTYGYVPAPKSVLCAVRKLPAGHVLVMENGRHRIDEYWDADFARTQRRDEGQLVEELRALLADSVKGHLLSDVALGSLLSAGIDSSTVTALATQSASGLKTFTVGFEGVAWNEAEGARDTASFLGTRHREVTCDPGEARHDVERLVDWFDEPFADLSALPTALISRVAREDVTVALSGDGGDELFGGYRHYTKFFDLQRRDVLPLAIRRGLGATIARRYARGAGGRRSFQRWAMDGIARNVTVHGGMTRPEKEDNLPTALLARFADYDDYWAFRRYWRDDLDDWSRLQYLDLKTYLPDDVLTKVDRVSMDVSLEVRPPILDHRIVEFAASVPWELRTPGGKLKHLLKKSAEGLVPDELFTRPKQGFSVPAEQWLNDGVFGDAPDTRQWQPHHRVWWSLLGKWTASRLGADDPTEILMQGP